MSFSDFNLNKEFIQSIEEAGYKSPTELQSQLIPLVAARKSALIWSQSASGKTGAFLIPAMNYILENPAPEKRGARVLILTSRRDRVSQINYTIKRLSSDLVMRFGFIVSGRPYQTQMRLMRRPLDIMIATPGRLNDLMNNGKADFSQLEMLIIDDLSSIYKKNLQGLVENILNQADSDCSSIVFVRGSDEEIKPYAESLFSNSEQLYIDDEDEDVIEDFDERSPRHRTRIDANQGSNNSTNNSNNNNAKNNDSNNTNNNKKDHKMIDIKTLIPQKVYIAEDYTHKIAMLDHLMDEFAGEPTLIYTATNKAAKILQENLSNHGHAAELIDEVDAEELTDCDIIIYSDQSKKTIDSDLLQKIDTNIINFDLPNNIDNYLNRLNRHQLNREKASLLMVDGYNYNELKDLEKRFGTELDKITIPGLEPLKPFMNLSPAKRTNKSNQTKKPSQNKRNNNRKANDKTNNGRRAKSGGRAKTSNKQTNPDGTPKRQHKGPFGRLNGGTHRKNSNKERKVGVSRVGTDAPKDSIGRGFLAEATEKAADTSKPVAIRYSSKKRKLTLNKPEEKVKKSEEI